MSGSYGKTPSYVSPFVADALFRARLRANSSHRSASSNSRAVENSRPSQRQRQAAQDKDIESGGGGWDSSVSRNVLFDPSMHKQELFKLPPRKPPQDTRSKPKDGHVTSRRDDGGHTRDNSDREYEEDSYSGHNRHERESDRMSAQRMTRRRPEVSTIWKLRHSDTRLQCTIHYMHVFRPRLRATPAWPPASRPPTSPRETEAEEGTGQRCRRGTGQRCRRGTSPLSGTALGLASSRSRS